MPFAAFIGMWRQLETHRIVGGVFANDADANAWGEALPPELRRNGFQFFDPGRFQTLTDNFSAHITAFKSAGADIITGNMIPPDFTTFWTQALQQGLKPRIATVGKALLFPASVEALGTAGDKIVDGDLVVPASSIQVIAVRRDRGAAGRRLYRIDRQEFSVIRQWMRPTKARCGRHPRWRF